MKRNILAVTALVALAASLAACHDSQPVQQQAQLQPQQQYQQAPQPQYQQAQQPQVIEQPAQPQVIVQQPQVVYAQQPQVIVQHDNSGAALATGMALGMMAGGGGSRDVHHYHYAPAPVVQRVYVNKTYVRQAPAAVAAPVAAPAPRQYASRSVQTTSSGLKKR